MLIVSKIEVKSIPDQRCYQIATLPKNAFHFSFKSKEEFDAHKVIIDSETIYPEIFINQRGEKVRIGLDSQSQEILGLCFEAFHNLKDENRRFCESLYQLSKAKLWQRIKWVFTGVK